MISGRSLLTETISAAHHSTKPCLCRSHEDGTGTEADRHGKVSLIEVYIGGMTCISCEQTLQAGESKLDGIKSIKASRTAACAFIEYYHDLFDTLKTKDVIKSKRLISWQ